MTLRGTVIDPQGRPVEGAWVEVQPASVGNEAHTARTDKNGHSRSGDYPAAPSGWMCVTATSVGRFDPAIDSSREIEIPLRPRPQPGGAATGPARPPGPVRVAGDGGPRVAGRQVVRWQTPPARRFSGQIVVLDFWCATRDSALPVLNKLKDRFEPRGSSSSRSTGPGRMRTPSAACSSPINPRLSMPSIETEVSASMTSAVSRPIAMASASTLPI